VKYRVDLLFKVCALRLLVGQLLASVFEFILYKRLNKAER